jgi:hypothetical protein
MGLVSSASGSQLSVINTEHSLSQKTGIGIYVLVVDTSAMEAGDTVEVRIKTKCISSGTVKIAYLDIYSDVQDEPHKYSVPVPVDLEIICTIKQTTGTGKTFPWNLLRV